LLLIYCIYSLGGFTIILLCSSLMIFFSFAYYNFYLYLRKSICLFLADFNRIGSLEKCKEWCFYLEGEYKTIFCLWSIFLGLFSNLFISETLIWSILGDLRYIFSCTIWSSLGYNNFLTGWILCVNAWRVAGMLLLDW